MKASKIQDMESYELLEAIIHFHAKINKLQQEGQIDKGFNFKDLILNRYNSSFYATWNKIYKQCEITRYDNSDYENYRSIIYRAKFDDLKLVLDDYLTHLKLF